MGSSSFRNKGDGSARISFNADASTVAALEYLQDRHGQSTREALRAAIISAAQREWDQNAADTERRNAARQGGAGLDPTPGH